MLEAGHSRACVGCQKLVKGCMQAFSGLITRKRVGTVLQRVLHARVPIVKMQDHQTGALPAACKRLSE